ncbi:MAG: NAD(P)/FAD-dependent oxidoreductase [Gemmatimonadetes bacterium]|nr:NAD(P)/FAD-dependent oxidoreductase [Gemmatimonadota bacterium]
MATRTLILGGGFGGLAAATELARLLGPAHEVLLLERRDGFFMGLRKLWVLIGRATLEEGRRPLARLAARGIRFVQAEIRSIDPVRRRVETNEGAFEADYIVVALGAEPRPERVPGLEEHGFNLYDAASVEAAARRLADLDGGRIAVAIAGLPYKCPPAPYEAAMLLDDRFRERGLRSRFHIFFSTLQPALLPNAGPEGARWVAEQFGIRGIEHHVSRKVEQLEAGRIVFDDGELPCDVALIVPPHAPPRMVQESGLGGEGGWIPVDARTLATQHPGVWAVGDVTHIPLANATALPKAGIFAEAQAQVVAQEIAAALGAAAAPPSFDGRGACFIEMGGNQAALVEGDFYAQPAPAVRIAGAAPAHLREKHRFEAERLERWLG